MCFLLCKISWKSTVPRLPDKQNDIDLVPAVLQINQSVMEAALSPDMLATDLAYYLVRKGVSLQIPGHNSDNEMDTFHVFVFWGFCVMLCCRCHSERPILSLAKLFSLLNPKISPSINWRWRTWVLSGDCRVVLHTNTRTKPEKSLLFHERGHFVKWFFSLFSSPLFGSDVSSVWDYRSSVEQYSAPGGTAKSSVASQVEHLRNWLRKQAQWTRRRIAFIFWIRFTAAVQLRYAWNVRLRSETFIWLENRVAFQ